MDWIAISIPEGKLEEGRRTHGIKTYFTCRCHYALHLWYFFFPILAFGTLLEHRLTRLRNLYTGFHLDPAKMQSVWFGKPRHFQRLEHTTDMLCSLFWRAPVCSLGVRQGLLPSNWAYGFSRKVYLAIVDLLFCLKVNQAHCMGSENLKLPKCVLWIVRNMKEYHSTAQ